MNHGNWTTWAVIGAVGLAVAFATGINPGFLLILLVCPLMMFFMMKGMGDLSNQHEDHIGHRRQHDPTRADRRADR